MVQQSVPSKSNSGWTFLSNHTHLLVLIAQDPQIKLRDAALRIGITERAVQRIVADLEAGEFIEREREGRRNHYRIHPKRPLRHPIESHISVGDLLDLIVGPSKSPSPAPKPKREAKSAVSR